MEMQEQIQGAVTVLKPSGPLLSAGAEIFKTRALAVAQSTLGRLVLDASAISYLDSRGIEVLVELTEQLADGGKSLKISSANSTLREVLDLVGWSASFEFFDDCNAAVRSFL